MSRYYGGWGRYGGWAPYVPVAQRRADARRETDKLRKQGKEIEPVTIEGRTIARSFWGKGWCDHLESFGDYSNRLPRGRTYVRNGSVCHLGIGKGAAEALVSGSSLYRISVDVTPLKQDKWDKLKKRCTGKIGSLIELLQGRLSEEVMATVTDPGDGLFPKPGEIHYKCNCPDWAGMCKHIAAVMYGIGARLDNRPELLFVLRGVKHEDLISADAAAGAIAGGGSRRTRRRVLSGKDLENVFDVELEEAPAPASRPRPAAKRKTASVQGPARKTPPVRRKITKDEAKPGKTSAGKSTARKSRKPAPFQPTGRAVTRLRKRHRMTKAAFAQAVGVSVATVANWENTAGTIAPHAKGLAGLTRLHDRGLDRS